MARILVVDDDDTVLGFAAEGLKLDGHEVLEARDGEESIRVAKASKPQLIFLDLAMPNMNGYQVCEVIRATPELKGIKIVVTSGKNYPVDIKMAKQLGADDYLVKPYGLSDLRAAIQKQLDA